MLDGATYFASFPDETPRRSEDGSRHDNPKPRLMTPELRAALEQLAGELQVFLKEHEQ